MGKVAGMKSEWFFCDLLRAKGIAYIFENDWYDFLVKGIYKVELKSCQISIKKNGERNKKGKSGYAIGRFDFTNEDNLKQAIKENIWIGLVVRHKEQFIMYGFIKAEKLKNRKRYLTIHQARDLKPLSFEDWVLELYGE